MKVNLNQDLMILMDNQDLKVIIKKIKKKKKYKKSKEDHKRKQKRGLLKRKKFKLQLKSKKLKQNIKVIKNNIQSNKLVFVGGMLYQNGHQLILITQENSKSLDIEFLMLKSSSLKRTQ